MRFGLFFILIFLSCLTACKSMSDECKEGLCWNASYVKTPCGGVIADRCQAACDACVFNEPICKTCMKCMDVK
jgi:hypothetical protein